AALAELFERAGAEVARGADGPAEEWKKAMANIVINPLGALLERRNGELLEVPAVPLFRLLAGEAQKVSDGRGFDIDVLAIAEAAARQTAENRNSMWQDLTRGRETEIGALTGKFVEIAEKAGFDVPGHRAVLLGVRAMEKAEKRDG
ncbi:MAG: 2-dehydropantoate 2-reductase, partial [bacterium]|nr:2-dehydropantoate 2-reductase [bacterium]